MPAMVLNLVQGVSLNLEYYGAQGPAYDPEAETDSQHQPSMGWYKMVGPATLLRKCDTPAPNGMLSPLCVINLPQEARREAGVPKDAKFFAFLYPQSEGHDQHKHLNLKEQPWAWLFLIGGFAYFDEQRKPVSINAYKSAHQPKTQQRSADPALAPTHVFFGPTPVTAEATQALGSNGRLSLVMSPELQALGFHKFGWVHPNEKVGGHPLHAATEQPNSYGAFVFVKKDGASISYRLGTADSHSVSEFFTSKAMSPFHHLRMRIEADIRRTKGQEATQRAKQEGEQIRQSSSGRRAGVGHSLSTTQKMSDVVFLAARDQRVRQTPCYVIHPEHRFMGLWDFFNIIALLFTATVTPFEVALLPASENAAEALFIINRLVDGVFFVDMILQFFVMYRISLHGPTGKDGHRMS